MGIVQGTIPVFVILGMFLATRITIPSRQILGVILTLLGVLTVALEGRIDRLAGLNFNPGDLMMITACMLYAGYTIGLRNKPAVSALSWFAMLASAAFAASVPLAVTEWVSSEALMPSAKGWGVIALIVTPILAIILCITLIGLPLGIGALFVYAAGIYLSKIFVAAYLGREIVGARGELPTLLGLLAGLVILQVLSFVPYAGAILGFAIVCVGLGAPLGRLRQQLS
jgi:hypothetical protein